MKKLLIASAVLAVSATAASAQDTAELLLRSEVTPSCSVEIIGTSPNLTFGLADQLIGDLEIECNHYGDVQLTVSGSGTLSDSGTNIPYRISVGVNGSGLFGIDDHDLSVQDATRTEDNTGGALLSEIDRPVFVDIDQGFLGLAGVDVDDAFAGIYNDTVTFTVSSL